MRRFLYLSFVTLFSGLSVVSFFASSASAASSYDGLVNTVSPLIITDYSSGLSKTLSSDMEVLTQALQAAEARCNQGTGPDPCTMRDDIENIINGEITDYVILGDNYNYGQSPTFGTFTSFRVFWSPSNQGEIYFSDEYAPTIHVSAPDIRSTMPITYDDSCPWYGTSECLVLSGSQIQGGIAWGHDQADIFTFYSSTFSVDYPAGYEGEMVPTPGQQGMTFTPKIMYSVYDDGQLKALNMGPREAFVPNDNGILQTAKIEYLVTDENDDEIDRQSLDLLSPYSFDLPGLGDFKLTVRYVHPGPPMAPYADNVTLRPVVFSFANNGLFFIGTDHGDECDTSGDEVQCSQPSPYKDCAAVWGESANWWSAVPDYVVCIGSNVGIWIRGFTVQMFVPSYTFFNSWRDDFGLFWEDKLGFVYQSVGLVGGMFGDIMSSAATPKCTLTPSGQFMGSDVEFDICAFEDIAPVPFNALRFLIIGITMVGVTFMGYRKYMEVMSAR